MVGTPRYMSPEQLRGEAVDGRTDEFAFGLLAFELLAAKHPYDATPAVTTPQMVANGFFVVPRISERAPGLPAGVDELVARCLAAEPKDRVASMSEVREAIAAVRRAPSSPTFTSGAPITVASPQHVTSSAPRMAGPTVGDVDLRGPTIADGPEAAWLGAGPTETMHALTPAPLASRRMWWLVGTLALLVTVAALGITRVRALRRRDPPTITAPTVSVVSVAPPATSAPAALPSAAPPTTDATPLPSAVPTTAPRKASARPHAPPPAPSTPPASSSARLPPPSDEIPSIRK
jgi:serine/threonine protein kinase